MLASLGVLSVDLADFYLHPVFIWLTVSLFLLAIVSSFIFSLVKSQRQSGFMKIFWGNVFPALVRALLSTMAVVFVFFIEQGQLLCICCILPVAGLNLLVWGLLFFV